MSTDDNKESSLSTETVESVESIDMSEYHLLQKHKGVLELLLRDRSTDGNIRWCTDSYTGLEEKYCAKEHAELRYGFDDCITIAAITLPHERIINPRCRKSREEQDRRVKDKAEVFTPAWICNKQNNLIDEAWFGYGNVFNHENEDKTWTPVETPVQFPEGKSWQEYVFDRRLEICCGEGPYLCSRYNAVSGKVERNINARIGLLDRKLRVVSENVHEKEEWLQWALYGLSATYGYEWQGDNLLLAREAAYQTFLDFYAEKFKTSEYPSITIRRNAAEIISWNLWQMDGLKFVIPNTCHEVALEWEQDDLTLFDYGKLEYEKRKRQLVMCPGCFGGDRLKHNGVYCKIRRWWQDRSSSDNEKRSFAGLAYTELRFVDLLKTGK